MKGIFCMSTTRKEKRLQRNVRYMMDIRRVKLLNVLMIVLPYAIAWFAFYRSRVCGSTSIVRSIGMMAMYTALYCLFTRIYGAFHISIKRISEIFGSQILSVTMANGFILGIMFVICGRIPNVLPLLGVQVAQVLISLIWAKKTHMWFFNRFERQKTVIIYDRRRYMENLFSSYGLDKKYDICAICTVEEFFSGNMKVIEDVDAVFLGGVHSHERNIIIKYCVANGIDTYMIPRIGDVIMSSAQKMHMFHLPILRVRRYTPTIEFLLIKRLFDIVSSLAVIIVFSPVLLATAIAIKKYDGGPAIYKQVRLTKDGKEFEIYKFRSMRIDAEKDGVARLSSGENDDRITPIGHIIRKYRLDELPQLFNILRGDMSVVGPRPERPEIAQQYEQELPEFALRLQAKAGLTGYAQVYGKYNTDPYDKLQMDLMYIANPSVWEDMKIILATIYVLFVKESTEGVQANQVTAMSHQEEDDDENQSA